MFPRGTGLRAQPCLFRAETEVWSQKETADRGGLFASDVQRSEAERVVEDVAQPAHVVAAAIALATAAASVVAVAGLAAGNDIELFVIEKVAVHGRLLLFDEERIRFVYGQEVGCPSARRSDGCHVTKGWRPT